MNKKIKKNIILICVIMIFIHLLGLVYQILSNYTTLSILLKELFIFIYIIHILLLKFEFKHTKYICYVLNIIIAIISGIYSDFSSVIISVLLILYMSNLYSDFTYVDNTQKIKQDNKTKTTNNKRDVNN